MADLGSGISLQMGLDSAEFMEKLLQLERRTATAVEQLVELAEATDKVGSAASKSADAVRTSSEQWTELKSKYEIVAAVAQKAGAAIMAAVNQANEMDPKGAIEWNKQVRELQNTFMTLVGTIGAQLRPAIETVMKGVTQVLQFIGRINFSAIWKDLKQGASDAIKWFTDGYYQLSVLSAQMLVGPFQLLIEAISHAIAAALDIVATQIDSFSRLLNKAGLGGLFEKMTGIKLDGLVKGLEETADATRQWAKDLDLGKALVDGAIDLASTIGNTLKDGIVEGVKTAKDYWAKELGGYMSAGPMKVYRPQTKQEADNANYQAELDAFETKYANLLREAHVKAVEAGIKAQKAHEETALTDEVNKYKQISAALDQAYAKGDRVAIAIGQHQLAAADEMVKKQEQVILMREKTEYAVAQAEVARTQNLIKSTKEAADIANKGARDASNMQALALLSRTAIDLDTAKKKASIADAAAEAAVAKGTEAILKEAELKTALEQRISKMKSDDNARLIEANKKAADFIRLKQEKSEKFLKDSSLSLVTGAGGTLGSTASGIKTGFEDSGEVGAIVGGIVALLSKSKGFQELVDGLNVLLDALANAVGQLLQGLTPLIQGLTSALTPVIIGLGKVLGAIAQGVTATLMPAIPAIAAMANALGNLLTALAPVIAPLFIVAESFTLILPALALLSVVLPPLMQVLEYAAKYIAIATDAIAKAWNWMVTKLQDFLHSLADVPVIGAALQGLAGTLDSFKIGWEGVTQSMTVATSAADNMAVALDNAAQKLQGDWANVLDATTKAQALSAAAQKAQAYADAHPDDADAQRQAAALAKAANQAARDSTKARDQYAVDKAQQAFDKVKQYGPGNAQYEDAFTKLQDALAQQALDAADNTSATKDNTKATKSIAESLSNIPSFYKLAVARDGALGGNLGPRAVDSGSAMTFNGDIHINANNVEEIKEELRRATQRDTYRKTATLSRTPGGRNLTVPG